MIRYGDLRLGDVLTVEGSSRELIGFWAIVKLERARKRARYSSDLDVTFLDLETGEVTGGPRASYNEVHHQARFAARGEGG